MKRSQNLSTSHSSTTTPQTTSLSSSIFAFTYENGRRYASDRKGDYHLPNDETEQERLDILHHLWGLLLDGELHSAPITKDWLKRGRVLDLGTGTGIWAIDFGDMYPEAEILGTDLSPIQPSWCPPNVRFEIDDFTEDWVYSMDKPFHYIHMRTLLGCAVKDWTKLFKKAYDHLIPGGYIEIQEGEFEAFSEDRTTKGSAYEEYIKNLVSAGETLGIPFTLKAADYVRFLEAAGFVDIKVKRWKVPLGTWAKDQKLKTIGGVFAAAGMTGMEAYGLAMFTRVLGKSKEEAEDVISRATKDMIGRKVHSLHYFYTVYACKPE